MPVPAPDPTKKARAGTAALGTAALGTAALGTGTSLQRVTGNSRGEPKATLRLAAAVLYTST